MFQELASTVMSMEQALQALAHGFVSRTSAVEKFFAPVRRLDSQGLFENGYFVVHLIVVRHLADRTDHPRAKRSIS